ncbi:hypothetical protein [Tropicibacter alexandrii]|uniref:hypothetical protein n=1 Tax=Tropicibacter alexandrii TaxID=2267683 RepID=UPI001008E8A3|nr:hypothetical protein [Tropicibacter alexandrii]
MTKKPFTRFSVRVDDKPKQLFKARCTKDGTILLVMAHGDTVTDVGEISSISGAGVKEQRYSIHPSPKADLATIKQTLTLDGGKEVHSILNSWPLKNGGVQPIYSRLAVNLGAIKYNCHPGAKDAVRSLGRLNPLEKSLIYNVAVAPAELDAALPFDTPTRQLSCKLDRFKLIVSWTYAHVPTHWQHGRLFHFVSKAPSEVGGTYNPFDKGYVYEGLDAAGAAREITSSFFTLNWWAIYLASKVTYDPFLHVFRILGPSIGSLDEYLELARSKLPPHALQQAAAGYPDEVTAPIKRPS